MSDYLCLECGQPTPSSRAKTVCGEPCRRARQKKLAAENYQRKRNDPEYLAQRYASQRKSVAAQRPEMQERRLQRTRDWRQRNAEQRAKYEAEYRRAKSDQVRAKNHRRRARLLNAFVEDVNLAELWARDGGCCGICGGAVDIKLAWPDKQSKTLDHIVPLSRGGEHSWANAQLAHAVCNSRKNDRLAVL
jgi:5-methylcytosine-specific restriction endonuclease McrA